MSARLGYADHLKVKGIEDANAYIEIGQSMLAAIC
jgi:hypothetical protein